MPTRGTTRCKLRTRISILISIHVPTRGTTGCGRSRRCRRIFQSTCPRGARRFALCWISCTKFQSTCPRGARLCRRQHHPCILYFNPRAHEGHDFHPARTRKARKFQSTCPRGARHETWLTILNSSVISIHVPTRGTTPVCFARNQRFGISIHVPTRGTTRCSTTSDKYNDFNPRAHEGHDFRSGESTYEDLYFNPRAHEGHDDLSFIMSM